MPLSCDEVNARLLDLVYGEGSADEQRALKAHVDGCARCQGDLAALGRTRATVRARLDDEPPPGMRARILEAAAQAIAAAPRVPATAPAAPARVRDESPSFWARLRGRWTLPTFATVGALAVMLLGAKVLLNPERTYERGRQGLVPEPPATVTAAGPSGAAEQAPAAEKDLSALPVASAPAAAAPRDVLRKTRVTLQPDRFQAKKEEKPAKGFAHRSYAEPPAEAAVPAEAPAPRRRTAVAEKAAKSEASDSDEEAPAPVQDLAIGGVTGGGAGRDKADQGERKEAARADRRALAESNAKASATVASAGKKKAAPREQAMDDLLEGVASGGPGAAPFAQPPPAATGGRAMAPAPAAAPAPPPPPAPDELVRRADRLYAERRWDEAAQAYQELLRRYPTAEAAPRWRTRVSEARRAQLASEPAKPPARPAAKAAKPAEAAPASAAPSE